MTFIEVWKSMLAHQHNPFHTARGLPFIYTISGGVVTLSRKANPIKWATVKVKFDEP